MPSCSASLRNLARLRLLEKLSSTCRFARCHSLRAEERCCQGRSIAPGVSQRSVKACSGRSGMSVPRESTPMTSGSASTRAACCQGSAPPASRRQIWAGWGSGASSASSSSRRVAATVSISSPQAAASGSSQSASSGIHASSGLAASCAMPGNRPAPPLSRAFLAL